MKITRHWFPLVKMGLLWVCLKIPNKIPRRHASKAVLPCRPIGCKTSLPWCRLCRFAQGESRRFRGMWMGRGIHHDSPAMTPTYASFKAGHDWPHHKKPIKIIQYFTDVYYTVFVCVWQWVWLCVWHLPAEGIIRGINWGGLAFFMHVAVSDIQISSERDRSPHILEGQKVKTMSKRGVF